MARLQRQADVKQERLNRQKAALLQLHVNGKPNAHPPPDMTNG